MRCIELESLVLAEFIHLSRVVNLPLSLHHLHEDTHGAGHVTGDDSWRVLQSLRDGDLANRFFESLLQPDAEGTDVRLRDAASVNRVDLGLTAQIFLDLVKVRLDADKLLVAILAVLLEDDFINVVREDEDINIRVPEWLHVRRLNCQFVLRVDDEVDLLLAFLHVVDVVVKGDKLLGTFFL